MADVERALLEHYNLPTLYPTEWPAEKDEDVDDSDDERLHASPDARSPPPSKTARHTRRFTILQKRATRMGGANGMQKPGVPVSSIVQKDEADPLGTSSSVVRMLKSQGLPVDDDLELRNHFLLSSRSFNPTVFLSEAHSNASTDQLLRGLEFLSDSIEKKSASLKVLVEENFERFVKAKATIDNVYREMRNHGADADASLRPRSRHSMQFGHFRNASGAANVDNEKRRRALVKESEFGVAGVKQPLLEATVKAEEIWGPALGGRAREEYLKTVLGSVEQNQTIFECGLAIEECIKRRDYDTLAEEYGRAWKSTQDARLLSERIQQSQGKATDQQVFQIIIIARVWQDIQARLEEFKRDTWRRLTSVHFSKDSPATDAKSEEYMELISILLQLGVEENPIWVWLLSRQEYLQSQITHSFERARVELEITRRNLANQPKPTNKVLAVHLRANAGARRPQKDKDIDTAPVMQFWDRVATVLDSLVSPQSGLLGQVVEFWEIIQSFVDGSKQRTLPPGIDGASRQHHRLSRENINEIHVGAMELFSLIRDQVNGLLMEPPVDDVSELLSPIPSTPRTPGTPATGLGLRAPPPFVDTKDIPPSPTSGEFWDKLAFWPPHSNSVSASTYISRINTSICLAAAEIASIEPVKQDNRLIQSLRTLVADVRERSITAICAAWLYDSENCKELEDWTRSPDKRDLTNLPAYFNAIEVSLLSALQKIVYLSDAASAPGAPNVISPPPQRHIEAVQKGFKHSLYKAFSGIMEFAATATSGHDFDDDDLIAPAPPEQQLDGHLGYIDATHINIRKLLTIANFQALRNDHVPNLVTTFESNFSTTISDDAKIARDVLAQMSARVFQSYVRPTVEKLREVITKGISRARASESSRPEDARTYVYDVLLMLVIIHTEVSKTAPSLTGQVLSFLLEQLSQAQLEAFKQRSNYSLGALMQATLDVEFLAQTLDSYTTQKASELQSQIYLALDERTDNAARTRLQEALPELRTTLKNLRDKTKGEFGCFKRPRDHKKKAREGRDRGDSERRDTA